MAATGDLRDILALGGEGQQPKPAIKKAMSAQHPRLSTCRSMLVAYSLTLGQLGCPEKSTL